MLAKLAVRALIASAASISFIFFAHVIHAAEVRLTLKGGGGFQIVGELKAFDGRKYTIINPSFGRMEVDAERFDCVSDNCPSGPVRPAFATTSLFTPGRLAELTIAGSNTVGNQLMPSLIQAFAAKLNLEITRISQPDPLDLVFRLDDASGREVARIKLFRRGSTTSFRALERRAAQIGMSSRPIKDAELGRLRAAGLGNMRAGTHEHILGLDGLVVLAAPGNPAISISIEDVAKVFAGQIVDWSQLGFPPGRINVYAPAPESGNWETFNNLVLRPRGLQLVAGAKRTADHAELADWVAADPVGIGVASIANQRSAKALNIEASCGLITPPSNFAVKTEEYPLSRRLYLYSAGRPAQPFAAGLLDFALSTEAQPTVRKADFVDQAPAFISFADQGSRVAYALNAPKEDFNLELMREFLTDLKGSDRLTVTYRFNTASFFLDNKSQQNIRLLGELLRRPEFESKTVKLIGFADSGGSFQTNLGLSTARAEAVRRALIQAGGGAIEPARLTVKGYGELAPVACNDTAAGKAFNRRVEVWMDRNQ